MAVVIHSGEKSGGLSTKNAQDLAAVFQAAGGITPLTDNSGGTASDTIAAITDTATKNAVASLAAKVNALISKIGGNV